MCVAVVLHGQNGTPCNVLFLLVASCDIRDIEQTRRGSGRVHCLLCVSIS
jgi:hypothetical protein